MSRAANRRRITVPAGGLIGILLSALLIAGPVGNAARAQSYIEAVRRNGGLEFTHYLRGGSCMAQGPVRQGPPAGVLPIRFTLAVTLTVVSEKGCKHRRGSYGMRWRFTVPDAPKEAKILIIYLKRGRDARAYATAHLIK
jgi:hypothetical protein